MNAISHHPTSSLVHAAAVGARPRRATREWGVMVVAALNWAGVAVVALACAGAGVTMWLRAG